MKGLIQKLKESIIQQKIIRHLEKNGWYVIKLIQTNKNGIADLCALKNGKVVFMEVKRANLQPTLLQAFRAKELAQKGFITLIVHDIKDIEHLC